MESIFPIEFDIPISRGSAIHVIFSNVITRYVSNGSRSRKPSLLRMRLVFHHIGWEKDRVGHIQIGINRRIYRLKELIIIISTQPKAIRRPVPAISQPFRIENTRQGDSAFQTGRGSHQGFVFQRRINPLLL